MGSTNTEGLCTQKWRTDKDPNGKSTENHFRLSSVYNFASYFKKQATSISLAIPQNGHFTEKKETTYFKKVDMLL